MGVVMLLQPPHWAMAAGSSGTIICVDGQGCSSVNPFQRMLLLLSLPTQPFKQQNPAQRGTMDIAVLMIYLLSAGLCLLQLGRGLEGIPTGMRETYGRVKNPLLGHWGSPQWAGPPSPCQDG